MEEQHEHETAGNEKPELNEGLGEVTPMIWVASLADYNAGRLVGGWIDATGEVAEIEAKVAEMLTKSPTPGAEEWAIFVTEGFGPLAIGEHESFETVHRIASGIAEHGPAFAHYVDLVCSSDPVDLDRFEEVYLGRWASFEEYVQNLLEDLGYDVTIEAATPPGLEGYVSIDIKALARDMALSGLYEISRDADGVFVFDMGR